jgi:hypothetical protein
MTKPASDSMSNHRRPDSLTDDKPEMRAAVTHHRLGLIALACMNDQISPSLSASATDSFGEVRAAP